jgi:diaminohydroxyphosphoribosylaminopyrimidine deaminase/5-amino-6-(5-phosphoribosylamino)uracil reductase
MTDPQVTTASLMRRAIARAEHSRLLAPPNPWVGALLVCDGGTTFEGGTRRPGDRHAERVVLDRAGGRSEGAELFVTLEPCSHTGRTSPCADAIVEAGVARVTIGVLDPDPKVSGRGVQRLRSAGVEVVVGVGEAEVERQLRPYLHHRRTGRPWVVNKVAATIDGRTAAADGSSQWITGPEARADVHRLRAQSDAIVVGAGTVRADDPRLTVRGVLAADGVAPRPPLRIVMGSAPTHARVRPCLEHAGTPEDLLSDLGERGLVQVMIEGGASVAHAFHSAGLVDQYVFYLGAAIMGGDDGAPIFRGGGSASIAEVLRGRFEAMLDLGDTLRVDVVPNRS